MIALLQRIIDPERLPAAFGLFEQMMHYHPEEPHWYLALIGVDPSRQGRGLGAALLRHTLARVDRERLPAYLESSNPANVPLYQRHGFEVVGTIQAADSPPMFPMIRRPA
jgi:ribosomal protein S18 acetylase RimI-like enzyme